MSHFIVWMVTPVVIMIILMMALGVLIFDFLYELFVNLIKSEDDDRDRQHCDCCGCLLFFKVVVVDKVKPRLFKRNGLWMARLGDRLTVGHTPCQAYAALMWKGFRESVYG